MLYYVVKRRSRNEPPTVFNKNKSLLTTPPTVLK